MKKNWILCGLSAYVDGDNEMIAGYAYVYLHTRALAKWAKRMCKQVNMYISTCTHASSLALSRLLAYNVVKHTCRNDWPVVFHIAGPGVRKCMPQLHCS